MMQGYTCAVMKRHQQEKKNAGPGWMVKPCEESSTPGFHLFYKVCSMFSSMLYKIVEVRKGAMSSKGCVNGLEYDWALLVSSKM